MISDAQTRMMQRLFKRGIKSGEELQLYMMSSAGVLFVLAAHVYFLILFFAAGVSTLKWMNLFSVLLYTASLLLLKEKKYIAVGSLLTIEVAAYSTAFGILAGVDTYCLGFFILLIGLQILFPYGSTRLRVLMSLIIVACTTVVSAVSLHTAPAIAFSDSMRALVLFSHVYIIMLGFVVELAIARLVRRLASEVEDARVTELSRQAYTDPLTGLYNRRYAGIYFKGLPPGGNHRCVAMLDIDDFKRINDSLGHDVGDEVLKFLSVFLTASLRKTDIAFRWGGEEFLVVLDNTILDDACRALDNLRNKLSEADINTSRATLNITVSIGVAQVDYNDIEGSIRKCDDNLYIGKRSGKNIVIG